MPKRTNPFQKLIFLLHRQLGNDADITESAELLDRTTGQAREVDVLITTSVAGHTVLIGIECISHKRPATVEWIEQMWGKHQHLPTNKLVLVSESGFYKTAKKKAGELEIEAIALEEAHNADWTIIVNKLARMFFAPISITPTAWSLTLREAKESVQPIELGPNTIIYDVDGNATGSLLSIIQQAITEADTAEVHRACSRQAEVNFSVEFSLVKSCFVKDKTDRPIEILSFRAEAMAKRTETTLVDLTHSSIGDTQIAYGQLDSKSYQGLVTVTERKGEQYKISLFLQSDDDQNGRIVDGIVPQSKE